MKIWISGYGSIGKRHHGILQQLFSKATFEINDPTQRMSSALTGNYDIGLICTDTANHLDVAASLKNKCGLIFIEKPLHSSVQEIKKFENILKNCPIHVGSNVRYTPAVQQLKKIKDQARMVRVTAMSNLLMWRNDPKKDAYSFHKSKGGGVLVDFIHEPDYISDVFGIPKTAMVSERRLHNSVTVDSTDSCMMLWEYEKTTASFCLSYSSVDYVRKVEVLQEDGREVKFDITKSDIEESYKKQWEDILANGPKNTYQHCLELYQKILET